MSRAGPRGVVPRHRGRGSRALHRRRRRRRGRRGASVDRRRVRARSSGMSAGRRRRRVGCCARLLCGGWSSVGRSAIVSWHGGGSGSCAEVWRSGRAGVCEISMRCGARFRWWLTFPTMLPRNWVPGRPRTDSDHLTALPVFKSNLLPVKNCEK